MRDVGPRGMCLAWQYAGSCSMVFKIFIIFLEWAIMGPTNSPHIAQQLGDFLIYWATDIPACTQHLAVFQALVDTLGFLLPQDKTKGLPTKLMLNSMQGTSWAFSPHHYVWVTFGMEDPRVCLSFLTYFSGVSICGSLFSPMPLYKFALMQPAARGSRFTLLVIDGLRDVLYTGQVLVFSGT